MSGYPTSTSPFPGMDPYLERHWGDVHARLIVYTSDYLQSRLPSGLHARVEEHVGPASTEDGDTRSPFPAGAAPLVDSGVALADPLIVTMESPASLRRHLTIVDGEDRLVTAIEILSPANKIGTLGRDLDRRRQSDLIAAGANLVEIDLVRQGEYVLAAPEEELPEEYLVPYRICVLRSIDYTREPVPPLDAEDAAWADELLKSKGLR